MPQFPETIKLAFFGGAAENAGVILEKIEKTNIPNNHLIFIFLLFLLNLVFINNIFNKFV